MSGSLNKTMLIGNLGADPEFRSLGDNGEVANLRIATTEFWKDRATGERKERTEWHSVAVFGDGLVDICRRFLRKGTKVYIEGQNQTRQYEKDGQTHFRTDVVVPRFGGVLTMLSGKNSDDSEGGGSQAAASGRTQNSNNGGGNANRTPAPAYDDGFNDDVPF